MKKSRTAGPPRVVESPTVRSLPLVEVLVDTKTALFEALLHESDLACTDPDPQFLHRPMRYDIGLPSPVI